MFPAWNMLHLTLDLSHHKICHKLHPDQGTDDCHLALQDIQKMKRRKRTSRWYLYMMHIGLPRKYLKEHCAFMSMAYHMGLCPYPCPYANYQMPSYMDSFDLSDISGL